MALFCLVVSPAVLTLSGQVSGLLTSQVWLCSSGSQVFGQMWPCNPGPPASGRWFPPYLFLPHQSAAQFWSGLLRQLLHPVSPQSLLLCCPCHLLLRHCWWPSVNHSNSENGIATSIIIPSQSPVNVSGSTCNLGHQVSVVLLGVNLDQLHKF